MTEFNREFLSSEYNYASWLIRDMAAAGNLMNHRAEDVIAQAFNAAALCHEEGIKRGWVTSVGATK